MTKETKALILIIKKNRGVALVARYSNQLFAT